MKILYIIYQVCFALPILLVLTILTALVTIIGSLIGGAHIWGYYPGKIWSQLICYILLIPVEVHGREKIHKRTSYVFVPNHQGAFDIFLIYGFLGRNFKWMMKKSLRKIPFVIMSLSVLVFVLHHPFILFRQCTLHRRISLVHACLDVFCPFPFGRNRFMDGQYHPVAVYPLSGAWKNLERAVYSDGHHFQLQFICQLESTSLEVPHVSREGTCPFGKYYQ